ncbi:MAG TPA: NAD-dependent epimerase/dehydratase family protein [Fimbriimonas sp.]
MNTPADRPSPEPEVGLLQWFHIGENDLVEQVLEDLSRLGVRHLRTGVSWADYLRPEGEPWYTWLLARLAKEVEVVPSFLYTPPSMGIAPRTSAYPRDPKWYADFIDHVIGKSGQHFDFVEIWNEPNNLSEWDWTLDPAWYQFSAMAGGAAHWAKHRGKKTVLGGMSPVDPNWLDLMFTRGVMQYIDVVGIHGFPSAWEFAWDGWSANVAKVREVIERNGSQASIWITETGHSTWRHDEFAQIQSFVEALKAPVDRVYWYGVSDLDPDLDTVDGFHTDEREYHFGIRKSDGSPKLLHRLWSLGGIETVRRAVGYPTAHTHSREERPALVVGGSGFIGTNVADRILSSGRPTIVFDSLARAGVEKNLEWLRQKHGDLLEIHIGDIRDRYALRPVVERAGQVFNLAAQVAVTTSLDNPIDDFERNARGTLNLLEEMRRLDSPPPLVFTSTNKVYGGLEDVKLALRGGRYEPESPLTKMRGIGEDRPLDFHSPYGCSKGTADQYVVDYARTFGIRAVVFRMSCIYGPHQFGTEDQGWVAHFLLQALKDRPITIYGDGKQVRDILFVDDLVDAFLLAQRHMDRLSGQAFNMGGGPEKTISLLELLDLIERLHGSTPAVRFSDWRPGDQRYYVSDTTKFQEATGWSANVSPADGIERLYEWLGGRPRTTVAQPRRKERKGVAL